MDVGAHLGGSACADQDVVVATAVLGMQRAADLDGCAVEKRTVRVHLVACPGDAGWPVRSGEARGDRVLA
jgi:hypothetical protein